MHYLLVLLSASLLFASCKKDEAKPATTGDVVAPTTPTDTKTPTEPEEPEEPEVDPVVERGAYLSGLMGCEHCHTPFGPHGPDSARAFAGALEIPEEFGTWRSLNITQDKETGIGDWTDEQIIAAIRQGKRPDGEQLFPIMPYLFYNALSDDDAKALVAYLRTVKPVSQKVERALDLKLPKIPAPPPAGAEPDRGDSVAYGQYLTSMMHCAACHTPMGPEGPDMSKAFAGGMKLEMPMFGEGVLYSSNLTSDEKTGIGAWKDEEIEAALRQMKKRDGSLIVGPMALYQGGWFALEEDDSKAIVAFLRSLPAIENEIPPSTFKPKEQAH